MTTLSGSICPSLRVDLPEVLPVEETLASGPVAGGSRYLLAPAPAMASGGEMPGAAIRTAATGHPVSSATVNLRAVLVFVKPHIAFTFVLVALTGSLLGRAGRIAGPLPVSSILLLSCSVALLSFGAECWTNLRDRDIDSVMARTAKRPLVIGTISVREAVLLAGVFSLAGLVLAWEAGPVPFVFLSIGFVNNVVVYSMVTKRATPWSVVLGSLVAPLTLWAGYAAVQVPVSPAAWLLGGMVGIWVFVHIWVIAVRHRDDYAKAGVPMAPLVWTRAQLAAALAASGLVMGALAVGAILALGGPVAPVAAIAVGVVSVTVTAVAAAVPWRRSLAGPLIHAITIYLILVLGVAIGCALR